MRPCSKTNGFIEKNIQILYKLIMALKRTTSYKAIFSLVYRLQYYPYDRFL